MHSSYGESTQAFAGDHAISPANNVINAASPLAMRHSPMLPRKRIVLRHNSQRIALIVVSEQLAYIELALRTSINLHKTYRN